MEDLNGRSNNYGLRYLPDETVEFVGVIFTVERDKYIWPLWELRANYQWGSYRIGCYLKRTSAQRIADKLNDFMRKHAILVPHGRYGEKPEWYKAMQSQASPASVQTTLATQALSKLSGL
jgi:hypothetical protein